MKCRYCNGTGEHINDANRMTTCEFCGGTGVIKPLTNEEWFCSLSTKEKAKFLANNSEFLYECGKRQSTPKIMYEEDWEYWLKEKHE